MDIRIMAKDKEDFILIEALSRPSELLMEIECAVSVQIWCDNYPPTPTPYLSKKHRIHCHSKETAFFYAEAVANQTKMDIKYKPLVEELTTKSEG